MALNIMHVSSLVLLGSCTCPTTLCVLYYFSDAFTMKTYTYINGIVPFYCISVTFHTQRSYKHVVVKTKHACQTTIPIPNVCSMSLSMHEKQSMHIF